MAQPPPDRSDPGRPGPDHGHPADQLFPDRRHVQPVQIQRDRSGHRPGPDSRPGYLIDRSFYKAVDKPDQIVESLKKGGIPSVERSFGYGLVSNGPKASGVRFWGIDPAGRGKFRTSPITSPKEALSPPKPTEKWSSAPSWPLNLTWPSAPR